MMMKEREMEKTEEHEANSFGLILRFPSVIVIISTYLNSLPNQTLMFAPHWLA